MREGLVAHGGTEEGTQGDAFFATFTSPRAALSAAVEIQCALTAHPWAHDAPMRVRMGVHSGEVAETSTGLVGYEVHRAARIAAVANGGQILLSAATAELVRDAMPPGTSLVDLGTHRLKDLGRPEVLFQVEGSALPRIVAPPRSLDNPMMSNNLPSSLSRFVGREVELREVLALLEESRLVTLTGAGGSGKTRLALAAAVERLDGREEGVWFVELAPVADPELVPLAVLEALGVAGLGGPGGYDALEQTLKDQRVLIVLDNCEHVIDAVAKLVDRLERHCPKVSLLATSREPLGVEGERVYRVRSLSLAPDDAKSLSDLAGSDAVAFFVAKAVDRDSSFSIDDGDAPLVASLCRRLDGIPLAMELATARLTSMSLRDLHDRLDHRFSLLTGGSRNALPRQQTLGAMVAWSYDLLGERERETLRRLTIFVESFDLAAAEAVSTSSDVTSFDVVDVVGSLVNKSLVVAERVGDGVRYRLLETIRQYALDQLLQVGGEAAAGELRRAHAEYFSQYATRCSPHLVVADQGRWLKTLDFDGGNLLAALRFFVAAREPSKALALVVDLHRFFGTRHIREPFALVHSILSEEVDVEAGLRARALIVGAGLSASEPGAPDGPLCTEEMCNLALALARELGDRVLECEVLASLSIVLWRPDAPERGFEAAVQSRDIARELKDDRRLAIALRRVSMIQGAMTDGVSAENREALDCARRSQDRLLIAEAVMGLVLVNWRTLDDVAASRQVIGEQLSIANELGGHALGAMSIVNLAVCECLLGELESAEAHAREGVVVLRRMAAPREMFLWALWPLVTCANARGQFERAATLHGVGEALEADWIEKWGNTWSPIEVAHRQDVVRQLRAALGDEGFARSADVGRTLTWELVLNLALFG